VMTIELTEYLLKRPVVQAVIRLDGFKDVGKAIGLALISAFVLKAEDHINTTGDTVRIKTIDKIRYCRDAIENRLAFTPEELR
jgi:hypothetical protein